MHLAIHLTPERKWFTSLERYEVFHYLIISAALIPCIHRSLSLWCAHTTFPPVCFSLSLQSLIWTLESAYYYLGEVRRVGAHIYWGCPTLWACTHITSSNFCSLPCEEYIVISKSDTASCKLRKLTSNSRVWIILSSSKALALWSVAPWRMDVAQGVGASVVLVGSTGLKTHEFPFFCWI